jgi:hypothetical protein
MPYSTYSIKKYIGGARAESSKQQMIEMVLKSEKVKSVEEKGKGGQGGKVDVI